MSTTFKGPIRTGLNTGNPQTNTLGFLGATKVCNTGFGADRVVVTLPPGANLVGLGASPVSAFTGTDPVSAMSVKFGNSADATRYGIITVSALGNYRESAVSASNDFDNGGTIVVTISALSTTSFTGGGTRNFIRYVQTE